MNWEERLLPETPWPEALGSPQERRLWALLEDDGLGKQGGVTWLIFWTVFIGLALLDMCCLAPQAGKGSENVMSGRIAFAHCIFWFVIGLLFNLVVANIAGMDLAFVWFNGYILEYLLSMDNVFFFHVVFKAYSTPPAQMYKGLFLGILGAVVLRLLFYFIGAEFFRLAFIVQIFFGLILVYSGFKTAMSDEDDDDPRENRCVKCLTRLLPLTDTYEDSGALFTRACGPPPQKNAGHTGDPAPQVVGASNGHVEIEMSVQATVDELPGAGASAAGSSGDRRLRGTMLLLVVVVLQVIDVVFAVDSVTAKIAEHDSIFINFSSSAFAMLCLRSMYFVLTRLLQYFRFLQYGVALILVLIGIKLMISPWVELPSIVSLATITGTFALSIALSAICPAPEEKAEAEAGESAREGKEADGAALHTEHDEADTSRLTDHRDDLAQDWEYTEEVKAMF